MRQSRGRRILKACSCIRGTAAVGLPIGYSGRSLCLLLIMISRTFS